MSENSSRVCVRLDQDLRRMHQDLALIIIMLIRILLSVIRAIRPYLVLKKNLGRAARRKAHRIKRVNKLSARCC